jgi:hypothetical protein
VILDNRSKVAQSIKKTNSTNKTKETQNTVERKTKVTLSGTSAISTQVLGMFAAL